MFAFLCKTCGHLHSSEYAGEAPRPHSCVICGSGIHYTTEPDKKRKELTARSGCEKENYLSVAVINRMNLHKLIDHSNWEVLFDASDERLKELGLDRSQVDKHIPTPKTVIGPATVIDRAVSDSSKTQDNVAT